MRFLKLFFVLGGFLYGFSNTIIVMAATEISSDGVNYETSVVPNNNNISQTQLSNIAIVIDRKDINDSTADSSVEQVSCYKQAAQAAAAQGKSTTVYESDDDGETSVEITKTPNGQKVITRSSSGTDISIQQSIPATSSSSTSENECQREKTEKIPTAEEFKQKIMSRMRPLSN